MGSLLITTSSNLGLIVPNDYASVFIPRKRAFKRNEFSRLSVSSINFLLSKNIWNVILFELYFGGRKIANFRQSSIISRLSKWSSATIPRKQILRMSIWRQMQKPFSCINPSNPFVYHETWVIDFILRVSKLNISHDWPCHASPTPSNLTSPGASVLAYEFPFIARGNNRRKGAILLAISSSKEPTVYRYVRW